MSEPEDRRAECLALVRVLRDLVNAIKPIDGRDDALLSACLSDLLSCANGLHLSTRRPPEVDENASGYYGPREDKLTFGNEVVKGAKCDCGVPLPARLTLLIQGTTARPALIDGVAVTTLITCACGITWPLPLKHKAFS